MFPLFIVTLIFSVLTALLASTQKAQRGNLKDFTFPQVGDGDSLIYAVGRVKIEASGLVWYGDFSTKPIKQGSFLGIGGATVGYKYYLGYQLVACIGPNARLRKVWFGTRTDDNEAIVEEDDPNFTDPNDPKVPTPIFDGDMGTGHIQCTDTQAFGGDTGGGGYDLSIDFYGGESAQTVNTYLESKINGLIPAWRGVCHLVIHGYIGNSTTLQNTIIEIERIFDPLGLGSHATVGAEGDANPANVIFELLTNNFGAASMPVNKINVASFSAAGQTMFAEDEGISISFGGSGGAGTIKQVIQDILRQIDATLYEDPLDGLVYLTLIRQDYNVDDLPVINISNITDIQNFGINLWSDTKNRIRVSYEDRDKWYDDRVAVGEDMANVEFQDGQIKGLTVQHPYIKRKEHANRVVAREMAIYSTPISKMTATTHRFDLALRPGSVIKFSYAPYNIDQIVMRVLKVGFGTITSNKLAIDIAADKFAKTNSIFASPSNEWARYNTGAANINAYVVVESPRWMNLQQLNLSNPDAPRALALPFATNGAQQAYNLWLRASGEPSYIETNLAVPYAEVAHLSADMAQEFSTIAAILADISDSDVLQNVSAAQIANVGANLIMIDGEIMGFETFSLDIGTGLYTLSTIHRGLMDTTVAAHTAGARVSWILTSNHVGLREFTDGDTIDVKMGSIALTGAQTVDQATLAII